MIEMSEVIASISVGLEFPLPLAPVGGESIEFVKSSHIPQMPKDIPQWEPFKEYSQLLPLVAKELGDRMEGKNVGPHVSRDRGREVCASLPVFDVKEPETPVREVVVASRVKSSEVKESIAIETPRVDKPEISQLETPRINKPEISQSEAPHIGKSEHIQMKEFETPVREVVVASRVKSSEVKEPIAIETPRVDKSEISQLEVTRINKPEIAQTEASRIEKPDHSQLKEIEKPVKEVLATSLAPANEKPEVTLVDIASARVSQNTVVQTPESVVVSRLVETVVETLAVTPTLSSAGEGEINIKLKYDILDGSSIKMEVKNGELKIIIEPTTRAAEEILLKTQEAFQNHLAERVTAWRINVGVATLDLRNNLRRKLEELS